MTLMLDALSSVLFAARGALPADAQSAPPDCIRARATSMDAAALALPRPEQLLLSRAARWSSVKGAYAATPGARAEKLRVLLVDDVFTTGATLDACAKALFAAGAASVYALTVARAVPQMDDFDLSAAQRMSPACRILHMPDGLQL